NVRSILSFLRSDIPPIDGVLKDLFFFDSEQAPVCDGVKGCIVAALRDHIDADSVARVDSQSRRQVDWEPAQDQVVWTRGQKKVRRRILGNAEILPRRN